MENQPSVKFGLDQVSNPTPKGLKTFFRLFSFLSGVVAIVMAAYPSIPEEVKNHVLTFCTVSTTIIHFAIKFFGMQDSGMEQ